MLAVGGTGESYAADERTRVCGMLSGVTTALDDRFIPRWVGYPASYGPAPRMTGMSYVDSVAQGVQNLGAALAEIDGPVAMVGYSQGAVVIRTFLHAQRAIGRDLSQVVALGFIADPHQPPGVVGGCRGWGVAGPGVPLPADIPARWVGSADDVICNAAGDSFVRDIADLTEQMSVQSLRAWTVSLWELLRSNGFQNSAYTSIRPAQWRADIGRLLRTMHELRGYLPRVLYRPQIARWRRLALHNEGGGRHTSYLSEAYGHAAVTGPEITGCQELAQWLQVEATFAATSMPRRARHLPVAAKSPLRVVRLELVRDT